MRAHGVIDRPDQAAGGDHVCWVYGTAESFAEAAREYLTAGLSRGDRLMWVGDDFTGQVDLPGAAALVASGALQLPRSSSAWRFVPADQFTFYDTATRRARDEGYAGLCVVAEVTATAADPARHPELVRWEHLADRFIARGSGMSALCLYERDRLPAPAVTELATVHPWSRAADEPPFRLWFDDGRLRLAGSVDTFCADRLATLLDGTPVDGPDAVLELSELQFVDAAGARVVARWAGDLADRGARLTVLGAPRIFRRIWQVLALDAPGVPFGP